MTAKTKATKNVSEDRVRIECTLDDEQRKQILKVCTVVGVSLEEMLYQYDEKKCYHFSDVLCGAFIRRALEDLIKKDGAKNAPDKRRNKVKKAV